MGLAICVPRLLCPIQFSGQSIPLCTQRVIDHQKLSGMLADRNHIIYQKPLPHLPIQQ